MGGASLEVAKNEGFPTREDENFHVSVRLAMSRGIRNGLFSTRPTDIGSVVCVCVCVCVGVCVCVCGCVCV